MVRVKEKISIVTTLFRSEEHIKIFYEQCLKYIVSQFEEYEFVIVNDGSPDDSILIAIELAEMDRNVKVVDLSRNFGHHKALLTGLRWSTGDKIFMLDVDLEEHPSIFSQFLSEYKSDPRVEHVFAAQRARKGNILEKFSGYIFYNIFNFLSDVKVEKNIITSRLMSRRFVDSLMEFKEQEIFIAGLCVLNGYETRKIFVEKTSTAKTSYSFSKKIQLLVNGITSFSSKPLFMIFYIGCIVLLLAVIAIGKIVYDKINYNITISGWASVIVAICFMGGLIIFSMGVFSIYLSKIFIETKARPYVIIKRIING